MQDRCVVSSLCRLIYATTTNIVTDIQVPTFRAKGQQILYSHPLTNVENERTKRMTVINTTRKTVRHLNQTVTQNISINFSYTVKHTMLVTVLTHEAIRIKSKQARVIKIIQGKTDLVNITSNQHATSAIKHYLYSVCRFCQSRYRNILVEISQFMI
jgi:hypothetical protein